jgi:hypothetical protein
MIYNIGLSLLIAISFSSFVLISMTYQFEDTDLKIQQEFFSNQEFSEETKVFLIGSSHLGILNATMINELVHEKNLSINIYNLALSGDDPANRLKSMDAIIKLKPSLIIYGLHYLDFDYIEIENSILPNPKIFLNYYFSFSNFGLTFDNPKKVTLNEVKKIFNNTGNIRFMDTRSNEEPFFDPYTPFHPYYDDVRFVTDLKSLSNDKVKSFWNGDLEYNAKFQSMKKIISKLQEHDIKIVILENPSASNLHHVISTAQKDSFQQILDDLGNMPNIKIYDFKNKYSELNIWKDRTHVAYSKEGMIFSKDIAKIIINNFE